MLASVHLTEEGAEKVLPIQWSYFLVSGHSTRYQVLGNSNSRRHCQSGDEPGQCGIVLMHESYRLGGEDKGHKVLVTIPNKLRITVSCALVLILFNKCLLPSLSLFLQTVT